MRAVVYIGKAGGLSLAVLAFASPLAAEPAGRETLWIEAAPLPNRVVSSPVTTDKRASSADTYNDQVAAPSPEAVQAPTPRIVKSRIIALVR